MGTLATLGLFVGAVLLLVWVFQRSLIYFPFNEVPPPDRLGLSGVDPVCLSTADGFTLGGWFFPQPAGASTWTVVVFNGNAGNRSHRVGVAEALRARGYQVLLLDYRGFGGNPGRPSETALIEDAQAAFAFLTARDGVGPGRLVYFGESLGSAVAVRLAALHPPAAMVLRSPFTSLVDVGRVHYPFLPVGWLLEDRFSSIDLVGEMTVPTLVVAGDRDRVVPAKQSRRLFERIAGSKKLVLLTGLDHNDPALTDGPPLINAVDAFLATLGEDGRR